MSLEKSYAALFAAIEQIVDAEPQKVPQLLAVILAGGPFRPFLEKPELLNRAVVMAKQYVADKKHAATRATAQTQTAPRGGRVMSVRDLAPRSRPAKA